MAPISVVLSSGLPIRKVFIRCFSFDRNVSEIDSCTSSREPAQQTCPWLNQIPSTTPSIALSTSASANTRNGDFPPSSSVRPLSVPAVNVRISRPTCVEPVKATLSTSPCDASVRPVSPAPVTKLKTPGGRPAFWVSSAK